MRLDTAWAILRCGALCFGALPLGDAVRAPPDVLPLRPVQTLRDTEPPPVIGPTFDDDRSLSAHARPVASYTLRARLSEADHTVTGTGTLTWLNASSLPASELYFHLYLNAFKNNESVFLRSAFSGNRSGHASEHWGAIDVSRLAVREMGGANIWPEGAHTEGDPKDQTDIRVQLPRPVSPGETLTVDLEWSSRLPKIIERTGFVSDFHLVAQWFPKIARREPDGTWAHFPFHAESEFYADFGSYDVTLDVPADAVVGATGALVLERKEAERRVVQYHADDVHDFAFTAWRGFESEEAVVDGVRVRVLVPRGNSENRAATMNAVRAGLAHFGSRFGRYPYATLTVVHPPAFASAAGGMEYPTLITTGFPWFTGHLSSFVERVTLHELGHQWFYGLVATDEHAYPFLDEGLTTYAESSAMRAVFGDASGVKLPGLAIDGDAYGRGLAVAAGQDEVVARPAKDFSSFAKLGALVYARTAAALDTIGRVYGRPLLERTLGRYARRYRFEHPTPKHFLAAVSEVMGDEARDALSTALFEAGWVDFVAKDLRTTRIPSPAGLFDRGGKRETVALGATPEKSDWVSRVQVYRHGTVVLPVDVELTFEDGRKEKRRWDGHGRFTSIEVQGPSPLVTAVVDPQVNVQLDENLGNNAVSRKRTAPLRISERAVYFAELLLGAL